MATHVTYEEAMANLQSMFQSIDQNLIAQMLQQNKGHLERTVEQLLMMGGDQSINQSSFLGVEDNSRRRSSAADAPRVGGSNLPDDFMRPPSYFGSTSGGQSQIDQDALLAQMLQDEMFMAEIRANPELYFDDSQQNQPVNQSVNQSHYPSTPSYQPPNQSINQSINQSTSQSTMGAMSVSSRGDFSGMGTGSNQSTNQSFKDKWNGLTAAAKKRLLTVAGRMKSNNQSANQSKKYELTGDLNDGLLDSDADFPLETMNQSTKQSVNQSNLISKKTHQSSESINHIDLINEVEDGVYVNDGPIDDDSASQSINQSNRGYVPPGSKRWGQKLEDQE